MSRLPTDLYFIFLALISCLIAISRQSNPRYIKMFPFFLVATMAIEFAGGLMSGRKIHTILMYNIFTSVEFLFYLWVLQEIIIDKKIKRIIRFCQVIYLILSLWEILHSLKSGSFHTETYMLGCLFIVGSCICYFFEIFRQTRATNLVREPGFWICSGLLFFYTCTSPYYGFANLLRRLPDQDVEILTAIIVLLNILLYSSFAIAFLCRFKIRKYTS